MRPTLLIATALPATGIPIAAARAVNEMGDGVEDARSTTKVTPRFMTDAEVPALDINVDTRDGAVTLFGTRGARTVVDDLKVEYRNSRRG